MSPPTILVVCTANICRSPAVERLLTARMSSDLRVISRGVRAVPDSGMCGVSGNWLATRGAFGVGDRSALAHVSRQVSADDIASSAMVLTASESQIPDVLALHAGAQAITYTLLEAARIIRWIRSQGLQVKGDDGPDRLQWLLETLWKQRTAAPRPPSSRSPTRLALRGRRRLQATEGDNIVDPHSGGDHRAVLPVLEETASTISDLLRRP